jgi:2-C-methyl-D-erythritol 4-phosphate cytidylyltransferase/2-C-methyl-D-erythritol 2,4-cyclodiphosphate synthase
MPKIAAIIPAAGSGTRMGLDIPKQFHLLSGAPILVHTVRRFIETDCIKLVVIVVPASSVESTKELFKGRDFSHGDLQVIAGGRRRQDSVKAGLDFLPADVDIVLVHDGARPLVSTDIIKQCADAAVEHGAAIVAVPVKDTIKKGNAARQIIQTVDRKDLWQAQTPQAARLDLLLDAYMAAKGRDVTDEASLLELANIPVHLIEGSETNIKITRPDDLTIAEKIMANNTIPILRVGHGYDAHAFAKERLLVLGGVTIPFELGLAGHSDADVLTHSLCDAILGALGAGDLGAHFPDTDAQFKDILSLKLLESVVELMTERGFVLSNADITMICQKPKLAPFIAKMKGNISHSCNVTNEQINIKATTTEKMGFTGRMEGISCHAVVLLTGKAIDENC